MRERGLPAGHVHRVGAAGPRRGAGSPAGCWSTAGTRSPSGGSPRPGQPGTTASRGRPHAGIAKKADTLLGEDPPAAHLGIDEHRRGRARWRRDEQTGEYTLLADRWRTFFYDLSGDQGMLGQVEGRTADDAAYWLAGATQDWRDAVKVVAIDMCTIYQSAVRRMLRARRSRWTCSTSSSSP